MATSGANYPGTISTVTGNASDINWTNAGYASGNDNNYTTCALTNTATSYYLKCQNFGFNLPDNAQIDGITVEVGAKANSATKVQIKYVYLVSPLGNIGGTNASTGVYLSTTETAYSFGGSGSLWNVTPTYADINDTDWGVAVRCQNMYTTNYTVSVDYIRMTINYTLINKVAPKYMYYLRARAT